MSPAFKGKCEDSRPRKPFLRTALAGPSLSQDDSKSQEYVAKPVRLALHIFLQFHKLSTNVLTSTEICWEKERH